MTICGQNLNDIDTAKLDALRKAHPKETDAALASFVRAAIDTLGGAQVQDDIDRRTRTFIHNSTLASVEDMIDQSFNRQLVEVIDKAITDALAGKSDELRSEIGQVVKKAIDAKLKDLKDEALAPTKKGRGK